MTLLLLLLPAEASPPAASTGWNGLLLGLYTQGLIGEVPLFGVSSGTSESSGTLTADRSLSGESVGVSFVLGTLTSTRPLMGVSIGFSDGEGTLTVSRIPLGIITAKLAIVERIAVELEVIPQ